MNTQVQAAKFFEYWVGFCRQHRDILIRDWSSPPAFTAHVLDGTDSIIKAIAKELKMRCYFEYYSTDAVLYNENDLVPGIPEGTTWLRRIRIAFEHENYFNSGLYQEVSHLLITDCDLRVLVSYPNDEDELNEQLEYLHRIIAESDRSVQIAETGAFLFIADWSDVKKGEIDWRGYVYEHTSWKRIHRE